MRAASTLQAPNQRSSFSNLFSSSNCIRRAFSPKGVVKASTDSSMSPTITFQPTATTTNSQPTLPRSGACAATLPPSHSHDVILFGGYTEQQPGMERAPTNEAWLFSKATGSWSPVQYSSSSVPSTRLVAQCAVVGDKLWLIGGWDSSKSGPEAFLGDVWTLDLTTWAWEQQQPAGEQLQGISRFQAVVDGSRILLHTHRCDNHILALHTDSSPPRIEKVSVKGPAPSSRGLHTVLKAGNALYLYGGAPQKGPMLDDLWRLDLTTMQWTQLQPKGQTPHARCSPAAAVVGRYLVYFGGAFYGASGGLEMLQDVQLYDIEANSWVVPEVAAADGSSNAELPAARNAAVMVPLSEQGSGGGPQLLLAGGWRAFVQTFNDTFLVQLSS